MRRSRLRRELVALADEEGLGTVQRVHRTRRGWAAVGAPAFIVVSAAQGAALATVAWWAVLLLLPVAAVAVLICFALAAPAHGSGAPRWYVVCELGLLIWSRGATAPEVVPWEAVTVSETSGPVLRLGTVDGDTVTIGPVRRRRRLARAVELRGR
ncbi:hypothetical protein [Streptomyces litchfieldiae]|uniref:Integral membrane protein n=1 Tax=Streptomyces litchfieldiae TaxID=3075543 RepID=A0ABU2MIR3_9ACTN|nr:hypothetical protein [Streptomyces sp. DSM 44938]MDT0341356.1 hypothetical protein [Streptomyces sp. DSM 44938]